MNLHPAAMQLYPVLLRLLLAARPDMVLVPAGPFLHGDDRGEADERPARRRALSAFAIDRTEVTAAAYAACVAAGRCAPPAQPAPRGDLPVSWVSHADAAAYCAFAGKRLPTEAEWEKAARGTDGRRFPWGHEPRCDLANFGNFRGDGRCAVAGAPGRPAPVGGYPRGASPYGALDMAGNVWEWVADRYALDYYQVAGTRDPKGPPARPGAPDLRVLRGGGCCSIFGLPRTTDRLALPADYRDVDIGFRCAL
jgi:serine/threonine-protein kinase